MRRRTFSGISRDIALIRQLLSRHFANGRRSRDGVRPRRDRKVQQRAVLKANA